MDKLIKGRLILPLLLLAEIGIILLAYLDPDTYSMEGVFRSSARWSGRLSMVFFLYTMISFARKQELQKIKVLVAAFAFIHYIHLFLLAWNVHLNHVQLVPYKLVGGALAYLMILIYPFVILRIKKQWMHLTYFLYVSFVMAMTYVARINGDFDGAEPELFHKAGLFLVLAGVAFVVFSAFKNKRKA